MTQRRRLAATVLLLGVAVALAVLLNAALNQTPQLPMPESRSIFPAGTPTPNGYRPGIVIVRDLFSGAGVTVTPMPGVVGSHVEIYWNDVQPDLTATPDWRPIQTRVAYLASQGRDAWLSLQFFQTDQNDPDLITAPSGLPTVTYTGLGTECDTEAAPDYGHPTFTDAYSRTVASMMATFGNDPNVAGFAIQMGASGEAMNVQNEVNCTKRAVFETPVPCQEYLDAVILAAQRHRAGTDKPITLASGIAACNQSSYNADYKANRYFFPKLNGTPGSEQYIAYRHNGLSPAQASEMYRTPTPGPFGRMQPGYAAPEMGGIAFEPGSPYGFPAEVPTPDREGYTDYMLLNAASANASNVFLQEEWYPYVDSRVLDTITQTLGLDESNSPIAWVWFRESEYKLNVNGLGYYYSGVPGPFTHLASVTGLATPTTYCSPNVRATSVAYGGSTPPNSCTETLSVPAARESRNALGYQSGATVGIDVQDDWQHAGNYNAVYNLSLRYLDNNTGQIVIAWKDTGGTESTHTITKTGGGTWLTEEFTATLALFDKYTTHDLELRAVDAQAVLNSLIIDYTADDSTPTPTPVPSATPSHTPTATATNTRTPRPTPTYVTATPTRTPTATPDWPTLNCPAITPSVNGNLSEWAAVTPVVLSASSAAVIQPPTPVAGGTAVPEAADLTATLYCGVADNVWYFAGSIADDVTTAGTTYSTTGRISGGDSVRITLDRRRDGLSRVMGDDHDLYVSPDGRVRDFDLYPSGGTAATATSAGAWTFELALPASEMEIVNLVSGGRIGLVWHVIDADSAAGVEHVLSDRKRMATIP